MKGEENICFFASLGKSPVRGVLVYLVSFLCWCTCVEGPCLLGEMQVVHQKSGELVGVLVRGRAALVWAGGYEPAGLDRVKIRVFALRFRKNIGVFAW